MVPVEAAWITAAAAAGNLLAALLRIGVSGMVAPLAIRSVRRPQPWIVVPLQ
jgi:hypothetical protein